jgi:hypothetical protein
MNTIATRPIDRWNGVLPVLMSLTVLAMLVCELGRYGMHATPARDENGADHVAMLLMFGQLPIIASFVMSGWRQLRRIAPLLTVQVALWLVVFALARLT